MRDTRNLRRLLADLIYEIIVDHVGRDAMSDSYRCADAIIFVLEQAVLEQADA